MIGDILKVDFKKALQNIRKNIKNRGVYIFDVFNLKAINDDIIDDFKTDIETIQNDVTIRKQQYSEVDRGKRLFISHDHYAIYKNGNEFITDQSLNILTIARKKA